MIKVAIATCWEEGPKPTGMQQLLVHPPRRQPLEPLDTIQAQYHCPASDEADDIGIVAIPHLSRDLMAVFDGPGSYYGTHPQNILRGMVYEDHEIPYFKIS